MAFRSGAYAVRRQRRYLEAGYFLLVVVLRGACNIWHKAQYGVYVEGRQRRIRRDLARLMHDRHNKSSTHGQVEGLKTGSGHGPPPRGPIRKLKFQKLIPIRVFW